MPESKRELALELYRHFDDLERYAAGLSEDAAEDYADTESAIRDLIYRISGTKIGNDYKSNRKLADLQKQIAAIRYNVSDNVQKLLSNQSDDLIANEGAFLMSFLLMAFHKRGSALVKGDIDNIRKYGKYHGLTCKQIIEKVISGDVLRTYETIANGLINGKTADEIIQDVSKQANKSKRYIKKEVNAIIDGISNDASLAFAAKNQLSLLFSSMLDDHVCDDCYSLEGEIYDFDDPDIPNLPLHIGCRCHLIPVYSSEDFYSEDYNITFQDYFNSMDSKEKEKRIGKAKYAGYKSGNEKINRFVDVPSGATITLAELSKRDKNISFES